jgi:hypothetical protein
LRGRCGRRSFKYFRKIKETSSKNVALQVEKLAARKGSLKGVISIRNNKAFLLKYFRSKLSNSFKVVIARSRATWQSHTLKERFFASLRMTILNGL